MLSWAGRLQRYTAPIIDRPMGRIFPITSDRSVCRRRGMILLKYFEEYFSWLLSVLVRWEQCTSDPVSIIEKTIGIFYFPSISDPVRG